MTLIAVRETPTITCPDWCKIPQHEHAADLRDLEGVAIHWSASQFVDHAEGSEQTEIRVTRMAYIDGERDNSDGPADLIYLNDTGLTEAQALQLAQRLVDAVGTVRA